MAKKKRTQAPSTLEDANTGDFEPREEPPPEPRPEQRTEQRTSIPVYGSEPSAGPEETPTVDERTLFTGQLLKRLRESRGMALKAIADRTRINAQSLAAVEDERFEDLPDAKIYIRGFVRCLATELGLDPDRVASSYLARWDRWHEAQNFPKKPLYKGKA